MLELDGSAGGGQLVRTALSLSALTGTPFEMEDVRGNRPTPGLGAQHLAAVQAVAAITGADVEAGDGEAPEVGTGELAFVPGTVESGEYAIDVGTAGSVTLVIDAVLPLATALDDPLRLTVRGGTDVQWSPPLDYHRFVKLPLLRRYGLQAALEVDRRGFYPAGGGAVTLHLAPSTFSQVVPSEDEIHETARVHSIASDDLASNEVADRQAAAAADLLEAAGLAVVERTASYGTTRSTGSAVLVVLVGDDGVPTGFSALGERGKPAADVAEGAAEAALAFRSEPGVVDPHMADQLVPYLALAGGEVVVSRVTDHVETVAALVEAFGFEASLDRRGDGAVLSARRHGGS